jgi:hypothetical protein
MNQEITLEAMRTDDDNVRVLPFPVTEGLAAKLDDQRERLGSVEPTLPGKQRYQAAREAGCFAAVAKGAKDRELKMDRVFIPGSELQNGNGQVRISALKATLPVPAGLHVKSITFSREGTAWAGQLEVKENV